MFHIADPDEVKAGKLTDVYFVRTMEILKAKKIDKCVKAEFIANRFPEDYGWGVLAGVEEAAYLLHQVFAGQNGPLCKPGRPCPAAGCSMLVWRSA